MDSEIAPLIQARQYDEAFGRIVNAFRDKVFRLACTFLRNEAQAEDAAQEVLIKVWKALPGYHGGASLSTWIYTITRNTCLTEIRRRAARPTTSLQDPQLEGVVEAVAAADAPQPQPGQAADLEWMLAQIPDRYRRVVVLFHLEQHSLEEVSAMLGIPVGTVKTFLFRGRQELLRVASRPPVFHDPPGPEPALSLPPP